MRLRVDKGSLTIQAEAKPDMRVYGRIEIEEDAHCLGMSVYGLEAWELILEEVSHIVRTLEEQEAKKAKEAEDENRS